jgi:hypothetical protein
LFVPTPLFDTDRQAKLSEQNKTNQIENTPPSKAEVAVE